LTTLFPVFNWPVFPFGMFMVFVYVFIVFYAITRNRLMDINVLIRKTLIYTVVMASLTIAYLAIVAIFAKLFQNVTGNQTILSAAVSGGLITLGFQPLRKKVQSFVDRKFFRQYVDREEKLYELSRDVITHATPEAMGNALQQVLMETFHPKHGVLFVRSKDGSGFSAATKWGVITNILSDESPLAQYFLTHPQPFLRDYSENSAKTLNTRNSQGRERSA
jgi:hypothetical protein